jgi:hypothetical protein
MTTFIAALLLWAVIAIPFSCLAYGIFLVRENKTTKFAAVYKRAVLFFGIFLVIIALYLAGPILYVRSDRPAEVAIEGRYLDPRTGDTLVIGAGQITIRNGAKPDNNVTGTYAITYPHGSSFFDDLTYLYSNSSASTYNRSISVQYIDSSEYRAAVKRSAKAKKKLNYPPPAYTKTDEYWIVPDGASRLMLISTRDSFTRRNLLKI